MRIHTNLEWAEISLAATLARVEFTTISRHGSRSHDHAFEVILSGESRRHQNGGPDMAATWDQWGVFLGHIFDGDANAKCWAYANAGEFGYKTAYRFDGGWPDDAHGDHTFRYSGIPRVQSCTKCSAETRW